MASSFSLNCSRKKKKVWLDYFLILQGEFFFANKPKGVRTGSAVRTDFWETTTSEGWMREFSTVMSRRGSAFLLCDGEESTRTNN